MLGWPCLRLAGECCHQPPLPPGGPTVVALPVAQRQCRVREAATQGSGACGGTGRGGGDPAGPERRHQPVESAVAVLTEPSGRTGLHQGGSPHALEPRRRLNHDAVRPWTFLHPGQKRRPATLCDDPSPGPSGVGIRLRLRLGVSGSAPRREPTTLDHAGGVKRSAAEMTTATLTADWLAYAEVCIRSASALHPLHTLCAPSAHPLHTPLRAPPCTRSEPPQAVPLLSSRGASGASALLGPSAGGDPGGNWEGGEGPYPDYLDSAHEARHEGRRQGPRVARGYFGCGDGGSGAGGYSQDGMCAFGRTCATP